MCDEAVKAMRDVKKNGRKVYEEIQKERILSQGKNFYDKTTTNHLKIFSHDYSKETPKTAVAKVKEEKNLSTDILVAAQAGRDVSSLFSHENSTHPPSLTKSGKMYHGTKADILNECLDPKKSQGNTKPNVSCVILDGGVMIRMLRPKDSITLRQYCLDVVSPYILYWLRDCTRVDWVEDRYFEDSIKSGVREERGTGVRREITPSTKIPPNWEKFLQCIPNKVGLYSIIPEVLQELQVPQVIG